MCAVFSSFFCFVQFKKKTKKNVILISRVFLIYSPQCSFSDVQHRLKDPDSCHRGLTFTWWGCPRRKPTELAHSFLSCSCVNFCLYGSFNCISVHKLSLQLSVFSLSSSGIIFALLVLSATCLFMNIIFGPDVIPSS